MVHYNFKKIQSVPNSKDMIDIMLSKTQRKTPTVVHKGYKISRIRQFYMRKVKYTQQNFHDKFTQILDDFPQLDAIHPFYSDLMNVLYDRDHYKLALGQVNMARTLVDNIAKDYVRLLKYADSLYQCKQQKRAALGRMCTLTKKLNASLEYLDKVRQHLARLPTIDPNVRTLLVTGFPNVGKSSFLNKVTRADVDVQPYAFTTKSLFVGHLDYKYLRWQVIDSPGILDHPLEERNTIEMQSITALAHLRAAVIFIIDSSESCGFPLRDQLSLFENIKALFAGKPLFLVQSKTDVLSPENMRDENKLLMEQTKERHPTLPVLSMSARSGDGVAEVVTAACEHLLEQRVEEKLRSRNVASNILSRMRVAQPQSRAGKSPESRANLPASVLRQREEARAKMEMTDQLVAQAKPWATGSVPLPDPDVPIPSGADRGRMPSTQQGPMEDERNPVRIVHQWKAASDVPEGGFIGSGPGGKMLERDLESAAGGPGQYTSDHQKRYLLRKDEFRYDAIPELMDGKNIADFVDPDIEAKLLELEQEEEERLNGLDAMESSDSGEDLSEGEMAQLEAIRKKKVEIIEDSRRHRGKNRSRLTRKNESRAGQKTSRAFKEHLQSVGLDATSAIERTTAAKSSDRDMEMDGRGRPSEPLAKKRGRSLSAIARQSSVVSKQRKLAQGKSSVHGARDKSVKPEQAVAAKRQIRKLQKPYRRTGKVTESDRRVTTKRPKHLFSGKRRQGTHDRR